VIPNRASLQNRLTEQDGLCRRAQTGTRILKLARRKPDALGESAGDRVRFHLSFFVYIFLWAHFFVGIDILFPAA
jgi:hypothetical protein